MYFTCTRFQLRSVWRPRKSVIYACCVNYRCIYSPYANPIIPIFDLLIPIIPTLIMSIPFIPVLLMPIPIILTALNGFPLYWFHKGQSTSLLHFERADDSTYANKNTSGSIRITDTNNATGNDSKTVNYVCPTQKSY